MYSALTSDENWGGQPFRGHKRAQAPPPGAPTTLQGAAPERHSQALVGCGSRCAGARDSRDEKSHPMREGLVSDAPEHVFSRVKSCCVPKGIKVVASSWAGLQGHPPPDGWELRSESWTSSGPTDTPEKRLQDTVGIPTPTHKAAGSPAHQMGTGPGG